VRRGMAVRQLRYCTHCGMPLAPRPGLINSARGERDRRAAEPEAERINFCRHCGHALRGDPGPEASARPALFLVADLPHNGGHLRRMGAAAVDLALGGVFALAAAGIGGAIALIVAGHHTPTAGPVGWVAAATVLLAYQPVFWARTGRTPGMLIFGIRVARPNGSRIGPVRAALRELAMVVSALPFGLGFLLAARDPRGQAWHDRLAGTVVVTANDPQPRARPRPS